MNILIGFLVKLSNVTAFIAECLRNANLHEEYYVYVPNSDKPKFIHRSYKSARQEAERLYDLLDMETVEILQVVNRFDGIPF